MRPLFAVALAGLLVAGCVTEHKRYLEHPPPGDVTAVDRIKELRRLVLLPPVYETDGTLPSGWNAADMPRVITEQTVAYLAERRGYEVVTAKPPEDPSPSLEDLRTRLLAYQAGLPKPGELPEDLARQLHDVASANGAQGVLVYGLLWQGMNGRRWATMYGVAFFTLSLGTYPYMFSFGTYGNAAVYDGKSGKLVWGAREFLIDWEHPTPVDNMLEPTFSSLPNALSPYALPSRKTQP